MNKRESKARKFYEANKEFVEHHQDDMTALECCAFAMRQDSLYLIIQEETDKRLGIGKYSTDHPIG
jgi:hypothetical protein